MDEWDDWDDQAGPRRDPDGASEAAEAQASADAADAATEAGDPAEDAVRRYLSWITDPGSVRDEALIAELERKIADASDPIEKIHLASDLHRARQVDGSSLRREFLAVARRWADAQGIVPEAFLELGVPAEDLRHAGFDVGAPMGRRAEVGTVDRPGRATGRRAPRASVEDIRAGARSFDGPFTIADLRDRVGGSPATVRKALEAMVEAGEVRNLGAADDWPGPGRPPHRYRTVS
ncbi:helix-turn-helix domain-containing protein [Actinomarinicola tropica]|uniref:Uncharacterized protein n=1 Tax=Actinomarinicola tropica TaxID=2789776 RepID=A0A5Q2RK99_9ACTN|nr:hypothetical protein [Actinomarinicola tropica]QGG95001.1 hypothetical protein GH723_07720 [Actinomarinicola tropica]